MRAREVMTDKPVSVLPSAAVDQAIGIMLDRHFSGLPVVNEKGALVGVVTEGDFLRRPEIDTQKKRPRWLSFFLSPGRLAEEYAHSRGRRVEDVMTRDVHTAGEATPITDIVDLMVRHGIKRVPIVRGEMIVGMVTRADVLRRVKDVLKQSASATVLDDAGIVAAVKAAFEQSDCIPAGLIDVSAHQGEVELRGCITDERERAAVKVAVEGIPGVTAVHDHLVWVEPMSGLVLLSPEDDVADSGSAEAA